MMQNLRIVEASNSDLGQLLQWNMITLEKHQTAQPYAFPDPENLKHYQDRVFRSMFKKALSQRKGERLAWLAKIGDQIVGYVLVEEAGFFSIPNSSKYAVADIFVDENFRGKGVGRALLDHLKSIVDDRFDGELSASVRGWNEDSANLFESAGFIVAISSYRFGNIKNFYIQDFTLASHRNFTFWIAAVVIAIVMALSVFF